MPEELCINVIGLNDPLSATDPLLIKKLTDIVPADAATVVAQKEIADSAREAMEVVAFDAAAGIEVVQTIEAAPTEYTEIETYGRDLAGAVVLPNEKESAQYGQFESYAARMLYQDIATAFTQRTLVGMDMMEDSGGFPDAALNHYLTVAIISFVNRLQVGEIDADSGTAIIQSATLEDETAG